MENEKSLKDWFSQASSFNIFFGQFLKNKKVWGKGWNKTRRKGRQGWKFPKIRDCY